MLVTAGYRSFVFSILEKSLSSSQMLVSKMLGNARNSGIAESTYRLIRHARGADYYDRRNKQRTAAHLLTRLEKLGYRVQLRDAEPVSEQPRDVPPSEVETHFAQRP